MAARVRQYLERLPPESRKVLTALRRTIRANAPGATEALSYGIPAFRFEGKILIWYAAWKEHTSLYPMTPTVKRALGEALEGYSLSKGTIRFPLDEKLPLMLVRRIVKARLNEIRAGKKPAR